VVIGIIIHKLNSILSPQIKILTCGIVTFKGLTIQWVTVVMLIYFSQDFEEFYVKAHGITKDSEEMHISWACRT
jgi:hypothetical protein